MSRRARSWRHALAAGNRPPSRAPGTPYAERPDPKAGRIDTTLTAGWARASFRVAGAWERHRLGRFADTVDAKGNTLRGITDAKLREAGGVLQEALAGRGPVPELAATAFALVREASHRHLGLRHHRVQVMGGAAMLNGALAEMETGEGKTITAMLPAATFALAGRPVHIVTVNDYLAERDATELRPVYAALGLSVGLVVPDQPPDERRAAYACDITYCTNKFLVFDYLRDRLALGAKRAHGRLLVDGLLGNARPGLLLRGLHVAIIDEADSVLIDEARTPLILSGGDGPAEDADFYASALALSDALVERTHYRLIPTERSLHLTPEGQAHLAELTAGWGGLWAARRAREELAEQALNARLHYHRDRQYVVADGKVQIVDEFTGRVMPDRSWERGLHQMIEAKEALDLTDRRRTLARITYQRFFRRYGHLCGMTGTAAEVAGEVRAIYGLRVLRIPTHHPPKRQNRGVRLLVDADAKWHAVVQAAGAAAREGRAVLVGTRSVEASETLAEHMTRAGLAPVVLNARQDHAEAEIIARAGQPGRITVATNMAGRGTDIRLSQQVRHAGGLHVILTEFHESPRIDRQLFGRGGRQGDPGSFEAITALDDEVFRRFIPSAWIASAAGMAAGNDRLVPGWAAHRLRRWAQAAAERLSAGTRRATLANDLRLEKTLAFSGQGE